ncbi:hypothetical protein GCM10010498_16330 [Streptomyces cavourensis]|nr:hypothetical protein GCM10010498_16330 [Streptomyces cavourensis]
MVASAAALRRTVMAGCASPAGAGLTRAREGTGFRPRIASTVPATGVPVTLGPVVPLPLAAHAPRPAVPGSSVRA